MVFFFQVLKLLWAEVQIVDVLMDGVDLLELFLETTTHFHEVRVLVV